MAQTGIFEIVKNKALTETVFEMTLRTDKEVSFVPGQFVDISVKNLYLRRPISVFDYEGNRFSIIYKVVGEGTKAFSEMQEGEKLDILYPLGNGYRLKGEKPLIIGGGVGIPPLFLLAKAFMEKGIVPKVIMGFNKKEETFCKEDFERIGIEPVITTVDGSFGEKGFVTTPINKFEYDYVYGCGPLPMLKAVYNEVKSDGQYSFEARMGCGFGACMGCSVKIKDGYKRICKDGPVLYNDEIIWD